ncbi:hypothetical protein MUP32_03620 [Candidatus Microgenomates bacterium]|nr:hypothetical protein [Candidatus Microgenomates bacterium]
MQPIHRLWRKKDFFRFLDKRQRFALQTVILTAGLLVTQLIWTDFRFLMVVILSLASYILSIWSLKEDIRRIEWIFLFILPVFFTASVSLFYFLLPARWIIRLFTIIIFSVGNYAILLVENIYNVAIERSIQLLRAAHSVGLLITLVIVFFSSIIIYSLRMPFWLNLIFMVPVIFPLVLQSLWSMKLEEKISPEILQYSGIITLGIGELAVALSFWPIANTAYALLMTASFYCITGIVQQHFLEKLFKDTVKEYLTVFIFTLVLTFLITKWG